MDHVTIDNGRIKKLWTHYYKSCFFLLKILVRKDPFGPIQHDWVVFLTSKMLNYLTSG